MSNKEQILFTISEASKYIGVTRATIYAWLKTGKLYTIDVGSVKFIPLDALQRLNKK